MLLLFEWLPSWIFLSILVIGLLGYALTFILRFIPVPVLYVYKTPIQLISILIIVIGSFLYGSAFNNDEWLEKIRLLEEQVKISEEKSKEKNVEIVEKIVTKDKIIKEKGDEIIKYVDREIIKKEEVVKFVENCPLPRDVIDAHNAAAIMNNAAKGNKK